MFYMDYVYLCVALMILSGFCVTGLALALNAPLKQMTWIFPFLGFMPSIGLWWGGLGQISLLSLVLLVLADLLYPLYLAAIQKPTPAFFACLGQALFAFFYTMLVLHPP